MQGALSAGVPSAGVLNPMRKTWSFQGINLGEIRDRCSNMIKPSNKTRMDGLTLDTINIDTKIRIENMCAKYC